MPVEVVAGHHIKDGIDPVRLGPVGQLRRPILGPVVGGDFSAEAKAKTALLVGSGGGGDPGAKGLSHLDGRGANAARAPLYQEKIAREEAARVEEIRPNRDRRLGKGRCVANGYTRWHGQALALRDSAIFGIAAAGEQGTHGISRLPAGVSPRAKVCN